MVRACVCVLFSVIYIKLEKLSQLGQAASPEDMVCVFLLFSLQKDGVDTDLSKFTKPLPEGKGI